MTATGAIRVLMMYDVPGWAWWHRVNNVRKHVSKAVHVDVARLDARFEHDRYDFVVILEAMFWDAVSQVPPEKVVVGCSCPKLVGDLVSVLRAHRPAAALVNNATLQKAVPPEFLCYCCPNGVDHELFTPAPAHVVDGLRACWVGSSRSFADKGLGILAEACRLAHVPFHAVDQAEAISSGRLYTHEGLRDAVYRASSVYLCASDSEGTPNPALEAMACGLPVVTTPVGNMPELVRDGETGFLVSRTVEAVETALQELGRRDWRAMGRQARDAVLNGWTWPQQARRYEAMFRDLHRRGRGAKTVTS